MAGKHRITDDSSDSGGGTRLLGVNQLQNALDKLTTGVNKLASDFQGFMNQPTGAGGRNGGGAAFSTANNGGNGGWGSNPASGYGIGASAAGTMIPPTLGRMSSGGGANGGGSSIGNGGTLNGQSSGGNGGWGGNKTLGGSFQDIGNYLQSSGGAAMPQMSSISSYIQQQSLMAGYNTTGIAMNGPNGFKTLNDIAINNQDRAQAQSLLNWSSGSATGMNNRGKAMYAGTNIYGMINPGQSATSDAQTMAGLYSNSAAMTLLQMTGRGSLNPGTGTANSMSSIVQSMIGRTFGGRTHVSQSQLMGAIGPNGAMSGMINALGASAGWNGQQTLGFSDLMLGMNKMANKYHMNAGQINSVFAGAAKHNQKDLSLLSGAGIKGSEIQSLKDRNALQSQRQGEEYTGYNAALQQSINAMNTLNGTVNRLISALHVGNAMGYAQGMGGASSLMHDMGGLASGGLGLGMWAIKAASHFGGAGASTNSSSSGTTAKTAKNVVSGGISGAAVSAVRSAESQEGVPYVWGGTQPGVGFDCSGLVQWAYGQAGVKLPRTSQQQWASLSRSHSVPTNAVQEGDLVFMAGSDGTVDAPGHVGLMVSGNMLIQAPYTGADVSLLRYDPSQWQHAARPTGPGVGGLAGGSGLPSSGLGGASGAMGGYTEGGSMGSSGEADALAAAMGGGALSGGGLLGGTSPSGATNGGSASGGSSSSAPTNSVAKLAQQMAAKMGWTGALWTDLNNVEMREAGWSMTAKNPRSNAYGIAQFINGASEYAQYGGNATTAAGQVTGFLNYVKQRYGNPANAWSHEQNYGWYARGTSNAAPGLAVVGENGPELVRFKGGEKVSTAGQTSGMLAGGRTLTPGYGGVGLNLTVHFNKGSIQLASMGNPSDVSNAASEIASQIASYLTQETLVQNIMAGAS